jgi:hypothetical protein
MRLKSFALLLVLIWSSQAGARLLVPMDLTQTDHLKAYGVAYHCLQRGQDVEWLLNYRGGSFLIEDTQTNRNDMLVSGVRFQIVSGSDEAQIYDTIENNNMEMVLLEKAPEVAIYTPPNAEPWDDAVTLALAYADIPFDKIWDEEVLAGKLDRYDWLHLHHEDFSGQYGRFYAAFNNAPWYRERQALYEQRARVAGYAKVWQHKHAVVQRIKEYIARGGFLFAMCSATDTFDIALAAGDVDIVDRFYDGDPPAPGCQNKLDFERALIFENFILEMNPLVYEYSDIDMSDYSALRGPQADYFTLFDFSAKEDPVPTMLTQCHVDMINGFMGQTTAYKRKRLKTSTILLAEVEGTDEVKYVHGNYGKGTVTFYGGHDPEDYQHQVGDPPTRLELHKSSPGYRLILNNILFPAAQKKERKT